MEDFFDIDSDRELYQEWLENGEKGLYIANIFLTNFVYELGLYHRCLLIDKRVVGSKPFFIRILHAHVNHFLDDHNTFIPDRLFKSLLNKLILPPRIDVSIISDIVEYNTTIIPPMKKFLY